MGTEHLNGQALHASCEYAHTLIPAYSVGATDAEEETLVLSHLGVCQAAQDELATYVNLAEAMLYSAPPATPPPRLHEKLVAATRDTSAGRMPSGQKSSAWHRLQQALAGFQLRPAYAILGLVLVALLATNLYWSQQWNRLRQDQRALQENAGQQADLLALVGHGDFLRIELPPAEAGLETGAYATVVCNPDREVGFILAESLPTLTAEQAYQVWLIRGEERVSGGLLTVDQTGNGWLAFRAPMPMGEFDAVGITAEPAGGSPGPTSPPVIRGPLY